MFRDRNGFNEATQFEEEAATPWSVLKQHTIDPFRNVESMSEDENEGFQYGSGKSEEEMIKDRAQNYRRFLIDESRKTETKWDSFSDTEQEESSHPKPKSSKKTKLSDTGKDQQKGDENGTEPATKKKKRSHEVSVQEEPVTQNESKAEEVEAPEPAPKRTNKQKRRLKEQLKAEAEATVNGFNGPLLVMGEPKSNKSGSLSQGTMVQSKHFCLGCRQPGHRLKDCRDFKSNVCIKCGSSEHKYQNCPDKQSAAFQFATCFVCKEMVRTDILSIHMHYH